MCPYKDDCWSPKIALIPIDFPNKDFFVYPKISSELQTLGKTDLSISKKDNKSSSQSSFFVLNNPVLDALDISILDSLFSVKLARIQESTVPICSVLFFIEALISLLLSKAHLILEKEK